MAGRWGCTGRKSLGCRELECSATERSCPLTVGKAIELADKLRANNGFDRELKILWLRQADAGLRKSVVETKRL